MFSAMLIDRLVEFMSDYKYFAFSAKHDGAVKFKRSKWQHYNSLKQDIIEGPCNTQVNEKEDFWDL